MVLKLFANVYVGNNNEVTDKILLESKIKRIIYVTNEYIEVYGSTISFGNNDNSFYEALDDCSQYIQQAITKNENILICSKDGVTEICPYNC